MSKHPASMTNDERDVARYRPEGWAAIRLDDGVSVVFYGNLGQGMPGAIAYRGKSIKREWFNRFRSEAERASQVQGFVGSVAAVAARKVQQAAEKKAFRHSLAVGDVLMSMWGYDQTNIDYYQVTRISAKSAWIRPIKAKKVYTETMQGDSVPEPDQFTGPEERHVVSQNNSVRIASFAYASRIEPTVVGGVKTWPVSHWTAYA